MVCWRAWYNPQRGIRFSPTQCKTGVHAQWFVPHLSPVLGYNRKQSNQWVIYTDDGPQTVALQFLMNHYPEAVAHNIATQLTDEERHRDVIICKHCTPEVDLTEVRLKPPLDTRLCDYAVDPIYSKSSLGDQALPVDYEQHEHWHEHQREHAKKIHKLTSWADPYKTSLRPWLHSRTPKRWSWRSYILCCKSTPYPRPDS